MQAIAELERDGPVAELVRDAREGGDPRVVRAPAAARVQRAVERENVASLGPRSLRQPDDLAPPCELAPDPWRLALPARDAHRKQNRELVEKQLLPGTTIQHVNVQGAPAAWIAGDPHVFLYLDERGDAQHDTVRLAGNTLLWSRGGTTYRFESALDRDAAVELAEALEPLTREPGAGG